MKTALELHARGRPIINCETWDARAQAGSQPIVRQGYVIKRTRDALWINVENSPGIKVFSTIPQHGTYGYERRSLSSKRGWRIDLSQIDLSQINLENDQVETP